MFQLFASTLVFTAGAMLLLWLLSLRLRDASIVDIWWGPGFAAIAAFSHAVGPGGDPARGKLVVCLAALWGLRLGAHLWRRVAREAEDGRYEQLRRTWGDAAARNLFVFFQVQALWAVLFALPMLAAAANPAPLGAWDALGAAVWALALAGEAIADRQLARFKADPAHRGQVCREGLWRYSRHPNYFFEWIHWWAYVAFAAGAPLWWLPLRWRVRKNTHLRSRCG